jgi:hypothetical protein
MNRGIIVTGLADESDVRRALAMIREQNWTIVDLYAPYAMHGLEELLGQRRTRLPLVCFFGGAAGLGVAFWFQFWTSTSSWPLNVGGRPWNSLPAFVPVAFESMVLLAGFSLVGALFVRCRLYPGKKPALPAPGVTDDRFALRLEVPADAAEVRRVLHEFDVVCLEVSAEGIQS